MKRIRYCVNGCGARTRKAMEDVRPPERPDVDIADSLLCLWCAEKEAPGTAEMTRKLTGHDNRKDWVRGRK